MASVPLRTTDTLDMLLRSVVDAAAAGAGGGSDGGGGGIVGWGDVLAGPQAAAVWSRLGTPLDAVPVGRSGYQFISWLLYDLYSNGWLTIERHDTSALRGSWLALRAGGCQAPKKDMCAQHI